MCISNLQDPVAFANAMREIESERSPQPTPAEKTASTIIATAVYKAALNSKPNEVAEKLLTAANTIRDDETRALMRIASVMLLELVATRDHYQNRTFAMEKQFGAIPQ
jgi:hypothetical protein